MLRLQLCSSLLLVLFLPHLTFLIAFPSVTLSTTSSIYNNCDAPSMAPSCVATSIFNSSSSLMSKSLCTSLFFVPHIFRLEAQSPEELELMLFPLCAAHDCTEHLQAHLHRHHLRCLLTGEEHSLGGDDDGEFRQPVEYITTRSVEGLCLTTVGVTVAARFYSPSLQELDHRLASFCKLHDIATSQLEALRTYVVQRCFSDSPSRRYQSRNVPSKLTSSAQHDTRRPQKVINSPITIQRVQQAMRRPYSRSGSNGLLVLPRFKLALCVPPKSGLVSLLFVVLALLGNPPDRICGCHDPHHDSKFGCHDMSTLRHYSHPMYEGLVFLDDVVRFANETKCSGAGDGAETCAEHNDCNNIRKDRSAGEGAGESLLRSAFTDPEWTTVMLARDPWRRALSAFHEDNGYQGWLDLGPSGTGVERSGSDRSEQRRDALLKYLNRPMSLNHGMPAASFCHLPQGLRFDHYHDIDSGLGGLADILATTSPPVPRELLTEGWERCTEGGSGSVLGSRLRTRHTWWEGARELDDVYCTPELVKAVVRHFREDYRLVAPLAGFPLLPKCLGREGELDLLLLQEE